MKKSSRIVIISVMMLGIMMIMSAGICVFAETGWRPSENQEKFEGIEYGLGMFSAAAKGTEIVVNNDGTISLNVTTKPMVSTKYTKVAFSTEKFADDGEREQAAAGIAVSVGTADDDYVNPFNENDKGIRTYYWSVFSYTIPVEALESPLYTAGFNVLKKVDEVYVEYEGKWAYESTWTIKVTPELISSLRNKQAELGESDIAARIGKVADRLEGKQLEKAIQAINAAKTDLTNKALIEEALAACEELDDDQREELADDIRILEDAKAEIERKEKEDARKRAIARVQAGKITGFKAAAGKRKVTFTWKKNTIFAGYQLKYKVGKKSKTLLIKNVKTVKKVVKKLKKGRKVTAQIRGYKVISGKKYYGKWAKAKTVKVK